MKSFKTFVSEGAMTFDKKDLAKLKEQEYQARDEFSDSDFDKICKYMLHIYSYKDALEILQSKHLRWAADEDATYNGFMKYYKKNLKQIEKLL